MLGSSSTTATIVRRFCMDGSRCSDRIEIRLWALHSIVTEKMPEQYLPIWEGPE
jgi:hypothetical protein